MKKFFTSAILFLCLTAPVFATVNYTRTPVGNIITSPVTFNVSFDDFSELGCEGGDFNYWALEISNGETITSDLVNSVDKTHYFTEDLPNGEYRMIDINCFEEADGPNYSGIFLEGDGINSIVFFVVDSILAAAGISNSAPQVRMTEKLSGTYRGEIPVYYLAGDADIGTGALKEKPISVFYSNNGGFDWQKIEENLPKSDVYKLDTTKIPDGKNYKIRVSATDGVGYVGNADSESFSIDNSVPNFDLSILPASIREKDTIEIKITSSEDLKSPPELKITQKNTETKTVATRGSGKNFSASYYVTRGSGKATISISGEDLVGNKGGVILSGGSFSVGFYGPPPPTISSPVRDQIFSNSSIRVEGKSAPNTKIVLMLNGTKEHYTQSSEGGDFKIDEVVLSGDNKGYNTLGIVAVNSKEEESEEVVLRVKLNSPPKISSNSIAPKESLSGTKSVSWSSFDANDDKLVFSIEYSNDVGVTWDYLVSDLFDNFYEIDTLQLADGRDYLIKITADDGTEKTSKVFRNVIVKNNLPHISLDIPAEYFTNNNPPEITGTVTGSEQAIASVEYSMDGGIFWQSATASDGNFNSTKEKFKISFQKSFQEGKYNFLIRTTDILNRSVKISRSFIIDITPPSVDFYALDKIIDDSMDTDSELPGLQFNFQGKTEPKTKIDFILEDKSYKTTSDEKGDFEIKNVTLPLHGSNKVSLSASDLAGNVTKITGVVFSNNPPQVSDFSPKDGSFIGGIEEILWKFKDPDNDPVISNVFYKQGDGGWISLAKDMASQKALSFSFYKWDTKNLKDASNYQLKLKLEDGISSVENIINVAIDNTPPEIEPISLSQATFKKAFTLNLKGVASDNFSGVEFVEYSIDGEKWFKAVITDGYLQKKTSFKVQHPFELKDGEYELGMRSVDRAGNISKPKFEKIIIDTTPPRIGSYIISKNSLTLLPDGGSFQIVAGSKVKFTISLESDAQEASLKIGDQEAPLVKDKALGLWVAEINPQELGNTQILITANDLAGNVRRNEKVGSINTIARGKISLVDENGTSQPVKDAGINILAWNEEKQKFVRWQSENYNEKNPVMSLENGDYELFLPPGKYQMLIQKAGFNRVRTNEFSLSEPSFINFDFALTKRTGIIGFFENILEKINP